MHVILRWVEILTVQFLLALNASNFEPSQDFRAEKREPGKTRDQYFETKLRRNFLLYILDKEEVLRLRYITL